jgi:hypothetical protein
VFDERRKSIEEKSKAPPSKTEGRADKFALGFIARATGQKPHTLSKTESRGHHDRLAGQLILLGFGSA